ncbi:MAG: hypothetical protein CFH06_01038 [Alphaproteobacteria bacterium MarineAlpha3_Bin5]|nr:MAG: hypothetical protein CFH06_01038 [Alphaproteobacteria bacterium MarineAlpha3_Bin5]
MMSFFNGMVMSESNPSLVLNADFQPLNYFPLSLWSWQDSIKAVFLQRVSVISQYNYTVQSPSCKMFVPSVIALKEFIPIRCKPTFTRFNVFLRDQFSCQYCGKNFPAEKLTFDHVIPRAHGGKTTWENVVTSCSPCNLSKGHRLPKHARVRLKKTPKRPTVQELQQCGRCFPPNYLHESWRDFLYWDCELES